MLCLSITAGGGLPFEQAVSAVELTDGIHISDEVVAARERPHELDLQILPRPANADAVILAKPVKQLDALLQHAIPAVALRVMQVLLLIASPLLIESNWRVFPSEVGSQTLFKGAPKEHASTSVLEQPEGLMALDPQLVCYSWITGIAEVAQVVFVRKRLVEIQYFHSTISDEQRQEFGQLVASTVQQIESANFLPHSGIRFPQNPCSSCPYVGLCLGKPELAAASVVRRPGAEHLGWLDELTY